MLSEVSYAVEDYMRLETESEGLYVSTSDRGLLKKVAKKAKDLVDTLEKLPRGARNAFKTFKPPRIRKPSGDDLPKVLSHAKSAAEIIMQIVSEISEPRSGGRPQSFFD